MQRRNRTLSLIAGLTAGGMVCVICVGLVFISGLAFLSRRVKDNQASSEAPTPLVFLLPTPSQAVSPGANAVLPTPIGFPDTAQDVGTMVLKPAPAFTLQDDTGHQVTVTPGQTGKPIVLVFNMGLG